MAKYYCDKCSYSDIIDIANKCYNSDNWYDYQEVEIRVHGAWNPVARIFMEYEGYKIKIDNRAYLNNHNESGLQNGHLCVN